MLSFGIEAGSVNDRPGSLSTYRFPAVSGRPETSGTPLTRTFPVLNQPNIGWDALTTTVGLHAVGAVGLDTLLALLGFRLTSGFFGTSIFQRVGPLVPHPRFPYSGCPQ